MHRCFADLGCVIVGLAVLAPLVVGAQAEDRWKIFVTNDNCPDYTWGLTEQQTREAFANVARGHLD